MHIDMACLSSKGQFVIPRKYRDLLKLSAGSKLVIVCDGTHLLLKPISPPDAKAFQAVVKHAHELTRQAEASKAKETRK
jgi:antitoxin PrlF